MAHVSIITTKLRLRENYCGRFFRPPDFEDIDNGDQEVSELMLHVDNATHLNCVTGSDYSGVKLNLLLKMRIEVSIWK